MRALIIPSANPITWYYIPISNIIFWEYNPKFPSLGWLKRENLNRKPARCIHDSYGMFLFYFSLKPINWSHHVEWQHLNRCITRFLYLRLGVVMREVSLITDARWMGIGVGNATTGGLKHGCYFPYAGNVISIWLTHIFFRQVQSTNQNEVGYQCWYMILLVRD